MHSAVDLAREMHALHREWTREGKSEDWQSFVMLMIGACNAVHEAERVQHVESEDALLWNESGDVAASLAGGKDVTRENHPLWLTGYHLNNAEMRTAAALHRLFKGFFGTYE